MRAAIGEPRENFGMLGSPISRENRDHYLETIQNMKTVIVGLAHGLINQPLNEPIPRQTGLGLSVYRILEELDFIEALTEMQ